MGLVLLLALAGCDSKTKSGGTDPEEDTTAPVVSLTVSETLVLQPHAAFLLTATATDDEGVAEVRFYDGDTHLATVDTAPFEHAFSLDASHNGAHTYRAEADDAAGNTGVSGDHEVLVAIGLDPGFVNGGFDTDALGWTLHNFDEWSGWTDEAGNPPGCMRLNEFGQSHIDPGIQQLVGDLIPGFTYEITGEYRPYVAWIGSPSAESFVVTVDSVVVAAFPRGPNGEDWSPFIATFTATATEHEIGFWGEHVDDSSYELDNVTFGVEQEPEAPATPPGLSIVDTDFTSLELAWNVVLHGDTYLLERSTAEPHVFETIYTGAANEYVDTDLVWAAPHHYRVRAVNTAGESAPSSVVSGDTDVPGGFVVSGSPGGDVDYPFTQVGDFNGHPDYQSDPIGLRIIVAANGDQAGLWVFYDQIEQLNLHYHPEATDYPSAEGWLRVLDGTATSIELSPIP